MNIHIKSYLKFWGENNIVQKVKLLGAVNLSHTYVNTRTTLMQKSISNS